MKRFILRLVAIVIIIAGLKFAFRTPDPKQPGATLSPEQAYSQRMTELTDRYNELEKEGQDANLKASSQSKKSPGSADDFLRTLVRIHNDKDKYVADLQAVDVPKKFEEAHKTFLEWRTQEQVAEAELLKGYAAVAEGKTKMTKEIDALVESSEKKSKEYEDKLSEYAKQHGYDSIQGFFQQKLTK
jgi:hypothetical protein